MSMRGRVITLTLLGASIAVACSGGSEGNTGSSVDLPSESTTESAQPSATASATPRPRFASEAELYSLFLPEERGRQVQLALLESNLENNFPKTDVTKRAVPLREIIVAVPRDGIAAITQPTFVSAVDASAWVADEEPVIAFEHNGEVRAYPLQVLIWHEVVNDIVGGEPILVTYCPLCNSAIAFDRRIEGETREFRVSGMLRNNDLVMYDVKTETLWQQITGEGLVGTHAGERLQLLPSQIVSFGDFRQRFPDAVVLDRPPGSDRAYGTNPYELYDGDSDTPFPVDGYIGDRLDAKERVLTMRLNDDAVAIPFTALSQAIVITAEVGGTEIVAFWQPGAVSPLDEEFIIGSRNVGSAGAFLPLLDGERLTFEARDGLIFDRETESRWSVLGNAVEGPLAGVELEPVLSGNHFWFAWAVFERQTRIVGATEAP